MGEIMQCECCGYEHKKKTNYGKRAKYFKSIRDRAGQCEQCGATGRLHVHHKKPVKEGGTDHTNNLIVLCPRCHNDRHKTNRIVTITHDNFKFLKSIDENVNKAIHKIKESKLFVT